MENYPKLTKSDFLMFSRVLHNGIGRCHVRCGAATAEPKEKFQQSMENCLGTLIPLIPLKPQKRCVALRNTHPSRI